MVQTKDGHLLTPSEAARYCEVSPATVKNWIREGNLKAFQTPGGHYRIARHDFFDFLERYQIPVQEAWIDRNETRVLVVDDDALVQSLVQDFLAMQTENYRVEVAADGYEALMKVGSFQPDIVILDLIMPDLDGFEVCRRLKADPRTKEIHIIALTGYPDEENIQKILESGAAAVLPKPLRVDALKREMRRVRGVA